jgi:hypothetical protein
MKQYDDASNDENLNQRFVPLEAITRVERESGRWIVYLNVPSWAPDNEDHPVANNWKRINDYSTEADAKVAATWFERSANRGIRPPTGF